MFIVPFKSVDVITRRVQNIGQCFKKTEPQKKCKSRSSKRQIAFSVRPGVKHPKGKIGSPRKPDVEKEEERWKESENDE